MDRRTFLQLSAVSAVAISIPMVHCNTPPNELLVFPVTLSNLCDEKTIRELGTAFINSHPDENSASTIQGILMEGFAYQDIDKEDAISTMINSKIQSDFQSSNTVVLKGWVLSITEARQCALYSLTGAK